MSRVKAFILDDEPDAVLRMNYLLKTHKDVDICGAESNPEVAIPLIRSHRPDLLFLDIEMPENSGFDVLEKVRTKDYQPRVIFTTAFDKYAIEAIKASAFDYILKPVCPDELSVALAKLKSQQPPGSISLQPNLESLTAREFEIFELLRSGQTSKQISARLSISKNTVDTHRRRILNKLNLSSTKDLILTFSSV